MLHVVLYQPEIPPNTGNIIRLCANTGAMLHLVGPIGFHLDEASLKRAGMDYRDMACVQRYVDWSAFQSEQAALPLWAFSTRGGLRHDQAEFCKGDALLFGPETRGLPDTVIDEVGRERCIRLPMADSSRSLNLSNCVAVGLFEAWRQLGFEALV